MNRRGVMVLFFDLPMKSSENRKAYTKFHKNLKQNGYMPLQESIYIKLLRDVSLCEKEKAFVRGFVPANGNVMILPMNMKTFVGMTALVGEEFDFDLFAADIFCV